LSPQILHQCYASLQGSKSPVKRFLQSPFINLSCTTFGSNWDSSHLVSNCKTQRLSSQAHKMFFTKNLALKFIKLTASQNPHAYVIKSFSKLMRSPNKYLSTSETLTLRSSPSFSKNTSHKTKLRAYPYHKQILKKNNINKTKLTKYIKINMAKMLISILPHKISHQDPLSSFINLKFPPWAPILIACILYYLMNENYKLLLWIFVIIPQCLKIDTLRPQYTPLNTQIVKSIFFLIILLSTLPSIPHTHKQPTHIRQHTINQLNTHKLSTTNQFLLQSPTCPRHTPRITYTKPNTNYNIPHNTLLHYIGYLILWTSIILSKCTHIIYHQPISPQKDRHTTKTHHKVATQSRNMKSQQNPHHHDAQQNNTHSNTSY
jgi:hypothetical protein